MFKYIKYILCFIIGVFIIDQVGNLILLSGLNKFFGLKQHSDILIIGHSHIMLAIDKEKLEKTIVYNQITKDFKSLIDTIHRKSDIPVSVSKYTREGVNIYDRYHMVKQYIESPYSDSLKVVLYGVDQFSFVNMGLSLNSYKLFYPFMDNFVINEYVKSRGESKSDYYIHKIFKLSRYSDALINSAIRGWRNDYSNYKFGEIDIAAFKEKISINNSQFVREIIIDDDLVDYFYKTMNLLRQKGVKVILINTPTIDILNQTDAKGFKQMTEFFFNFAKENDYVEYWDFNPQYSSDYSIFFDPIHLNTEGQEVITSEIINRFNNVKIQ